MAKERRRRAYLPAGIVILAVLGGGQYYLSNIFAPADTGTGSGGGSGSGAPGAGIPLAGAANPSIAVMSVYAAVGNDDPAKICPAFLSAHGELNFAAAFQASSCEDAVHKAHTAKVTSGDSYAGVTVPTTAVQQQGSDSATVYSCRMSVSGGQPLGMFTLSHTANGWVVDDLKPDPTPCPPAPTN